jgi:hypothetical protein
MLNYRIKFKNQLNESHNIDITSMVATPLNIGFNIDESYDSGSLTLPMMPATFGAYDFTQPFRPYTKFEIDIDGVNHKLYSTEPKVDLIRKNPPLYSHRITLIEPTKILEKRILQDMTVTQPQGELDIAYSYSEIDETTKEQVVATVVYDEKGVKIDTKTEQSIVLVQATVPNNPVIVSGTTMNADNTDYNIIVNYNLVSTPFIDPDVTIKAYIAGVLVHTEQVKVNNTVNDLVYLTGSINLDHTTTTNNDELTITASVALTSTPVYIVDMNPIITSTIENNGIETYAEVVDRILGNIEAKDINDTTTFPEFTLGDSTRAWLSTIPCPEVTLDNYTVFQALKELADSLKAFPRISEWGIVEFDLIGELNNNLIDINDYHGEIKEIIATDYINSLEVNSANVIESFQAGNTKTFPSMGRWANIRGKSQSPDQITQANSSLTFFDNIYSIKKVLVQGLEVTHSGGTYPSTTVWDITAHIVETKRFNSFKDVESNDYATRVIGLLSQGNTMPYTQGQNQITGFDHTAKKFFGTPKQAILEAIMTVAQQFDEGVTVTNIETPSATYEEILYQVEFVVTTDINIRQYKSNTESFGTDITLFSNESSKVTDGTHLGERTKALVNRLGNPSRELSGVVENYNSLPLIGNFTNEGEVVTNMLLTLNNSQVDYTAVLYTDYEAISDFIGVDSAYRQYQVPDKDIVDRQVTYNDHYVVSRNVAHNSSDLSPMNSGAFISLLANFYGAPLDFYIPTYCEWKFRHSEKVPSDGDWNTFDVEAITPIQVHSKGNSLQFVATLQDNYSVYPSKLAVDEDYYQDDFRYTDLFGNVASARIRMFTTGDLEASIIDANTFPELTDQAPSGSLILAIDALINKDARERIIYAHTMHFHRGLASDGTEDIRIYSGFAKYNGLASQNSEVSVKPVLLKDGYFPKDTSQKVIWNRVSETTLNVGTHVEPYGTETTLGSGEKQKDFGIEFRPWIDVPKNKTYTGYALVEKNSGDLIYAVKASIVTGGAPDIFTDLIYISKKKDKGAIY